MIFFRADRNTQSSNLDTDNNQINQNNSSRRGRKPIYANLSSPERRRREANNISSAKRRKREQEEKEQLKLITEQQRKQIEDLKNENSNLKVYNF
jgi:hypothetical protein